MWDTCSKCSRSTHPEILIFYVSKTTLEVSVPESGIFLYTFIYTDHMLAIHVSVYMY